MNQNHEEWKDDMPAEFQAAVSQIRSSVAPEESVKRFLLSAKEVESTVAAMKRASNRTGFYLVGICFTVAIGTWALLLTSRVNLVVVSIVLAYSYSVIGFVYLLIRGLRDKKAAGSLLLDCGRSTKFGMAPILLYLLPMSVVFMTCVNLNTVPWYTWVGGSALLMPIAIYFILLARGTLQIRTNGIWHYIGFMPWHEIESWGWTGKSESTLIIQKTNGWASFRRGAFDVPVDQKSRFEEYLQEYCVCVPERPNLEN